MRLIPYAGFDPNEHRLDTADLDFDRIWKLKRDGMTWREIAALLSKENGITYRHSTIYAAAKRGQG